MTWHEYAANGLAPTVWFLVFGGGCLVLTGLEIRDRLTKRRSFGWMLTGSTAFVLVVALLCLGSLSGRVDAYRLRTSATSVSGTGGSNLGTDSSGGSDSYGGGSDTDLNVPWLQPTARCADGTLSYSAHHQGTCSHHGGVAEWLDAPAVVAAPPLPPPAETSAAAPVAAPTAYATVTNFFGPS